MSIILSAMEEKMKNYTSILVFRRHTCMPPLCAFCVACNCSTIVGISVLEWKPLGSGITFYCKKIRTHTKNTYTNWLIELELNSPFLILRRKKNYTFYLNITYLLCCKEKTREKRTPYVFPLIIRLLLNMSETSLFYIFLFPHLMLGWLAGPFGISHCVWLALAITSRSLSPSRNEWTTPRLDNNNTNNRNEIRRKCIEMQQIC